MANQKLTLALRRKRLTRELTKLVEIELGILESFADYGLGTYPEVREASRVIDASLNQLKHYGIEVEERYQQPYNILRNKCETARAVNP